MSAYSDPESDDMLLSRALAGERQAVTAIYERYFESLYNFIRLRVPDSQTAEDLVSLVFEKFIRALKEGKGPQHHMRGWLFKVARNAIYDYRQQTQPESLDTVEEWGQVSDQPEPEAALLAQLDRETLRLALNGLPQDQLDVVLLRFDQQFSIQETASVMGKNINTVKTLQLRALEKLRHIVNRIGREGR